MGVHKREIAEGDVTGEAERERDPEMLALKMEEGAPSQGLQL